MLKKTFIFLFYSFFALNIKPNQECKIKALSSIIEKYGTSTVSNFCNLVYRRYYFIMRMNKVRELISEINDKISNSTDSDGSINTITLEFQKSNKFTHPKINKCINEFVQTKNFNSVLEVWNEISEYKKIDDLLLTEEFTRLTFLIFRNFHLYTKQKNYPQRQIYTLKKINDYLFKISLKKLLDLIDITIAIFYDETSNTNKTLENYLSEALDNEYKKDSMENAEIYNNVDVYNETEIVAYRFFFIQRLKKPISLLYKLKSHLFNTYSRMGQKINDTVVKDIEKIKFDCNEIQLIANKIIETKNINLIFDAWRDIEEYKYVDNENFLKGFIKITFIIYKNWLKLSREDELTIYQEDVIQLYEFSNLSPMGIIEKIDSLVMEINESIKKQKKSKNLLKDIIYKAWWIPPLMSAAGVYLYMKKHEQTNQPQN